MQVILSVPVPSPIVMSPLAIPYYIISSIMKEVSPFSFVFFDETGSDFYFDILLFESSNDLFDFIFVGEPARTPFLGPFSLLFLTYFTAYSLVKQSHIPSHATIIKSCSGFIDTFLISG
jgi:hypothetical protein